MALPHARALDVISVRPRGEALAAVPSTSLVRTGRLQLLHLVLKADEEMPAHRVDDDCTIHCLEGEVEIEMPGGTCRLCAGELVLLPAGQQHGVRARADAALLVTLRLCDGHVGGHGGPVPPG